MGNRFINGTALSGAIKDYFKALIAKGYDKVDIVDLNADLCKMIKMLPSVAAIEWHDATVELPVESDEYLVLIAYADKPTVLCYDAEDKVFFEERIDLDGDVTYKVTHWAVMPEGPSV